MTEKNEQIHTHTWTHTRTHGHTNHNNNRRMIYARQRFAEFQNKIPFK